MRSIKRLLWFHLLKRLHFNWTLRSGIGIEIRSYADWCSYNEMFANDEYTAPIQDLLSSRHESLHVMDLGANVGFFTLKLADLYLRQRSSGNLTISLVEASPKLCVELKRRLRIPGDRVRLSITNGLVGRRTGTARLNYAKEDNQNFVQDTVATSPPPENGSDVLSYVDLLALASSMPRVDLIKCDIEGSEFEFIRAYPELLDRTDRLVVEFHSPSGNISAAVDQIVKRGFAQSVVLREHAAFPVWSFSRA